MISRERFQEEYEKRFLETDRRFGDSYDYWRGKYNVTAQRSANTLWFYDLVIPNFDPQDKKIKICTTKKTGYPRIIGNAELLGRLMEINGGILIEDLTKCDAAVYWGEYLCDPIPGGVSAIEFISHHVRKRDITALLFYMGEQTQRHCIPNCDLAKEILELGRQGKKVLQFPLGFPYRDRNAPEVEVIG